MSYLIVSCSLSDIDYHNKLLFFLLFLIANLSIYLSSITIFQGKKAISVKSYTYFLFMKLTFGFKY